MVRERGKRAVLPPSQENIEKLEKTVNDGNYYGAQQMYKSVSARYVAAERYAEALDIFQSGASIQLRNGQVTCGAELAVLFVETLIKGKFQCSEETLDRVRKIYEEFPRITLPHHLGDEDDDEMQKLSEAMGAAKTRVDGCSSFLKAAIRWSAEFGAPRNGSSELHDMLAEYIYTESPEMDMARVSFHFVRGSNPEMFAATLVNFMGKCYPGEDDLAIARAILMYLSLGNLRDANRLMDEIKIQLKSKKLDFPKSDLIQFIVYLLRTLERDALPLFRILRQNYRLSIERDPAFDEVLSLLSSQKGTINFTDATASDHFIAIKKFFLDKFIQIHLDLFAIKEIMTAYQARKKLSWFSSIPKMPKSNSPLTNNIDKEFRINTVLCITQDLESLIFSYR